MTRLYALAASALLLTSCAKTVPVDDFTPDQSVAELAEVRSGGSLGASPSQATAARGAAALNLQPVTVANFNGTMEAGRGCTYTSAADELLLVSTASLGPNSRPQAVVRLPKGVVQLEGMRDGGYEYLMSGPAFQDASGMTISIVRQDNGVSIVPSAPATSAATGAAAAGAGADAAAVPVRGAEPAQSWPASMTVITDGAEQEYPRGIYTCGV